MSVCVQMYSLMVGFRYDKTFGDPYFNTREQSFIQHLLYLMTRWINPVTVHYIQPMRKLPAENAVQFSERVKAKISETAGLKNLSWDGYLKNYRPTREKQDKMRLETRQEYLKELSTKLHTKETADSETDSEKNCPSPNLPERDYLPEWLSEYERTIIQNKLLQDSRCHNYPIKASTVDERLNRSKENLSEKIKELRETISPKPSSI